MCLAFLCPEVEGNTSLTFFSAEESLRLDMANEKITDRTSGKRRLQRANRTPGIGLMRSDDLKLPETPVQHFFHYFQIFKMKI